MVRASWHPRILAPLLPHWNPFMDMCAAWLAPAHLLGIRTHHQLQMRDGTGPTPGPWISRTYILSSLYLRINSGTMCAARRTFSTWIVNDFSHRNRHRHRHRTSILFIGRHRSWVFAFDRSKLEIAGFIAPNRIDSNQIASSRPLWLIECGKLTKYKMPVPGTRLSAKIVSLFVGSQPCNQFASKQPFPVAYRLSHIEWRQWLLVEWRNKKSDPM